MKKAGGTLSIIGGIISFVGAFFAKKLYSTYSGIKVYQFDDSQKLVDTGKYLSRSGEGVSFSNILFWIFLILGFFLIMLGIALLTVNRSEESLISAKSFSSVQNNPTPDRTWKCSVCGTENSTIITKCLNCNTAKPSPFQNNFRKSPEEWVCPNCGKIQQHYVGTCGCGTPKP